MKRTVFVLGSTPRLAFLELQSLFPHVTALSPTIAQVDEQIDASACMKALGGTVKIVRVIEEIDDVTVETLVRILAPLAASGKITFGVSIYGDRKKIPTQLLREVKKSLIQSGVATRFVEAKGESALSSVVITKQNVIDIAIVILQRSFVVGATAAVQDFEDWNVRDYSRPAVDPHKGMLPPKVARMIVNIASRGMSTKGDRMLLDPFCGVGTILCEALSQGWRIAGGDIAQDAVAKTKKNISWMRSHYGLRMKDEPSVVTIDATHASDVFAAGSFDAIVTEPFMGDPALTEHGKILTFDQVKNTLKGLAKLYIGCLRDWHSVLASHGTVILAIPQYIIGGRTVTVKNVVDRCESLGYTLVDGPIEYSRPQAIVRREFYIFEKKE